MNLKERFVTELDGKGRVLSAFFSVLTLFAVLGHLAPGWYETMPEYTEWICGVTTWNAYNKQADMNIVQSALIGLPVLFLLFGAIYVEWKKLWQPGDVKTAAVFGVSYLSVLYLFFMGKDAAAEWLFLWGFVFAGFCILKKRRKTELLTPLLEISVIAVLAVISVLLCMNFFSARVGEAWQQLSMPLALAGGIFFLIVTIWTPKASVLSKLRWMQMLLPLGWMGFCHFRYRYEKDGSLIELFYSGKWKWFCFAACGILLICAFVQMRKKCEGPLLSTFIMAAAIRVFTQPDGLLNIDFFHNGEISMPMQQWISYGKLPYKDLIPIHGMCDYYYGLINVLFFDGAYLSLNAAKIVGDLLMAVLLAIVLYFFVENKYQSLAVVYLFMPFFISGAGMRYWFLFLLFFVLFSDRMIGKGMQSIYAWILLSILAIGWNASIGGAAALAFLPAVCYRGKRDLVRQWKELLAENNKWKRNFVWIAWGVLFAAGISFIPMFLEIVTYLRENTGTTLYVNGMEMLSDATDISSYFVPGLVNEAGDFWIVSFAFLIPLLLSFSMWLRREKNGAGEMFVTYFLAFWVLANYAFVRYDEGLRSGVLGVFFLLLTAVTMLWRNKKTALFAGIYTAFMALALMLSGDSPLITSDTLVLERSVPESISVEIVGKQVDDPVVHVSGELVGIPNLGTGFVQGNTLAGLQNVQCLLRAAKDKGKTVFDATNAVANAVIFDIPLYLPYSSAYNISNEVMQDNAIALLKEHLPDVILMAPEIRFDDAPFSYRSRKLYQFLMSQEYVPYKYENVIYLVRGENPLVEGVENREAFAAHMHKKDIGYLPAVWANSNPDLVASLMPMDMETDVFLTEEGYRVSLKNPVSGKEISAIAISGLKQKKEEKSGAEREKAEVTVTMEMESGVSLDGTVQFDFCLQGDTYLIPVDTSPYVTWQDTISYFDLKSDAWDAILTEDIKITLYQ